MYWLAWRTSDCADGKGLWDFFGIAVVALRFALLKRWRWNSLNVDHRDIPFL